MNNVKVYRHLKPNGETFYIGIGTDNRPYQKKSRSKFWKDIVKKYPNYEVQVLKSDLNWKDACELEQILISYYGRRDLGEGTLVNLTDGGEGSSNLSQHIKDKISKANKGMTAWNKGIPMSEEAKLKLSNSKKGSIPWNKGKKRTEETRRKISESAINRYKNPENNPFYGKKHSDETVEHLRKVNTKRLVKVDGSDWMTVREMVSFIGKSKSLINNYLAGRSKNKTLSELNLQVKNIE